MIDMKYIICDAIININISCLEKSPPVFMFGIQAHLANLEGTRQRMMVVPERLRIWGRGVWQ